MREMKDSGIEWIGAIPKHWSLTKIGMLYTLRNTKVSDKEYQPLSVTKMGVLPQLETVAKTNAHDDRKLVKKGDFAINSRSDRRGSCGISSYDGSVSLINTVLTPRERMHPGYYNWLFHTIQFSDEFYKNGHGIVDDLWTTNWQDMKKIVLPIPMYNEQQVVSDYLDQKCSEIDAISSDIQKQIAILEDYKKSVITEAVTKGLNPDVEMKDSGIDWIGKIPKYWKFSKIKYVVKEYSVNSFMNPDEDSYLGLENVIGYSSSIVLTKTEYTKSIQKKCKKGHLLFSKLRPYLAKVLICPFDGFCTSEFLELDSFEGDVRFLYYFMLNSKFIDVVDLSTYGAKMPRANSEFIMGLNIAYPNKNEQKQLADYLDKKCSEIDAIVYEKKKQIEILAEYKKSLIYEYVTGKKEVPES